MYDGTPCRVDPAAPLTPNGYAWGPQRWVEGKRESYLHRLAWIDAHGCLPPPETPLVLHHCDVRACNEPRHLYAGTHSDNNRDMWQRSGRDRSSPQLRGHGQANRTVGEQRPIHKLTDEIVREARREYARGVSVMALARRYGVAHGTMGPALRGRTWRHI